MSILCFHIFQRGFEGLNAIFQASAHATILPSLCITICTTTSFLKILLIVELLIKNIFRSCSVEKASLKVLQECTKEHF